MTGSRGNLHPSTRESPPEEARRKESRSGVPEVLPEEELLHLYLRLSPSERRHRFADTAATSHLVGVSRRTIQLWIELGAIRAVPVGHKYQVDLESVYAFLQRKVLRWAGQ